MDQEINRCRPGFGASCSFCCGSHNYKGTPSTIEKMFEDRAAEYTVKPFSHPEQSGTEKLHHDGFQCANVGISQTEPGIVCCLTYCEDHEDSGFASFFNGTCKKFHCSAWTELTDRQVLFCAALMKDWYYYSLLINFTELASDIYADYASPADVPADIVEYLKAELTSRLLENELF